MSTLHCTVAWAVLPRCIILPLVLLMVVNSLAQAFDAVDNHDDYDIDIREDDLPPESIDLFSCFSPPLQCPNVNVTFYLYTRTTDSYKLDDSSDQALRDAPFVPDRPVKILIHGYTGHREFQPNTEIRPALLAHDEYNIISVDWGRLAISPCYYQATKNVVVTGLCTAQLIKSLIRVRNIPLSSIHVIGFSLGAQVSSQVAQYLKPDKLTRITGLDPAMPLFATIKRSTVLDFTDAKFVDIIHTNAGNKGKYGPNGHVDFYVNGGAVQSGCTSPEVYDSASCSHARAPMYYAESISSEEGFWGQECRSWFSYKLGMCSWNNARTALMGEFADPAIRGQFFLDTNDKSPFARGKIGTSFRILQDESKLNKVG